jgi:hypothetical protein
MMTSSIQDMLEDVVALPPCRWRQLCPFRRFAVARQQPRKRAKRRGAFLLARHPTDGRLILCIEFRGAEFGPDANARPLADPNVPSHAAVPGFLAL